jgi:hypothetical protein
MRIATPFKALAVLLGLLAGCAHSTNPFYAIAVTITPASISLAPSASLQFSAAVQDSSQGVTWAVTETEGGTVTAAGLYTAPSALGTYHLTATSNENKAKAATAVIQVVGPSVITSFTATPSLVASGGAVTLQGAFSGGAGSISPGVGAVTSGQPTVVHPVQDTLYTLTVTASDGTVQTATAQVTLAAAPAIQSLLASATYVVQGGSVTLTPTFGPGTGAITPEVGAVISGTPVTVTPAATTTYTLTVTGDLGTQVTQALTVTVVPPLQIASFTANTTVVAAGGAVVLQPVFAGGVGVITPGVGAVASGQSYTVNPTSATTYNLVVTSPLGASLAAVVTVSMAVPPAIQGFLASTTDLVAGSSVTLTPTFGPGTGAITPEVGAVSSGAPVAVTPAATTTYTLTVTGDLGVQVTQALTVTVTQPLLLTSFGASPAASYPGAPVLLKPVFSGGTGAIAPGVGAVVSGQSYTVNPSSTTSYTLTVTDAQGNQLQATTQALVRAHGGYVATAPIGTPRRNHTATLLADGTVLVAGGLPVAEDSVSYTVLKEAERYDPAKGTFAPVGAMTQARTGHAATLLADGRVLLTGGNAVWGNVLNLNPVPATASAELWDPATGRFTAVTALMSQPRRNHTATLLPSGLVLICGGLAGSALYCNDILAAAEVFDPVAETFTPLPPMTVARQQHRALALADGTVLLAGGVAYNDGMGAVPFGIPDAEIFTLGGGQPFVATASSLATGRGQMGFSLLPDGRVLTVGGLGPAGTWTASVELYTPASQTFALATPLVQADVNPIAVTLASGQVAVIGDGDTEVFDAAIANVASVVGAGLPTGAGLTATPLATGKVLVVGLAGATLFDPVNP